MLTKRSKYNISKTRSSNSIVIDFSCSCIFWLPVWIVFIAIVFFGFICWPWLLFAGFSSHFLLVSLPVSNILVLYKLKRLHSRLVWNYLERLGWVSLENKFILWHSLSLGHWREDVQFARGLSQESSSLSPPWWRLRWAGNEPHLSVWLMSTKYN